MKLKILIASLIIINILEASEKSYWLSIGGGLGASNIAASTASYHDVTGNLFVNGLHVQNGISYANDLGGSCNIRCWDGRNRFFIKSLVGYLFSYRHFGISLQSGMAFYQTIDGGEDKILNRSIKWDFAVPIHSMFLVRFTRWLGVETGLQYTVSPIAYNLDWKMKLLVGKLPFQTAKE